MEKLKSPLAGDEYAKINTFFEKHKGQLHKPDDSKKLDEFIGENGIFLELIENISPAEKILAWMHLRKLVMTGGQKKKKSVAFGSKGAGGIVALVVLLVCVGFILYTCTSSSSSDKPKVKQDYEYVTDCQKMIERSAKHPNSVSHSSLGTTVKRVASGNIAVMAPFTAKNSFGVEIEHKAMCIFTPDGKKEISINP